MVLIKFKKQIVNGQYKGVKSAMIWLNTVIDVFVHMNKRTAVTRTAPSQG